MIASTPRPMQAWPAANRRLLADFRQWLRQGGYGGSTLKLYTIAARLALAERLRYVRWASSIGRKAMPSGSLSGGCHG